MVDFKVLDLNGQRYAQYGISKPPPYQGAERLKRATAAQLRCNPRIAYDRMLWPVLPYLISKVDPTFTSKSFSIITSFSASITTLELF
jgi:hypothetical protein